MIGELDARSPRRRGRFAVLLISTDALFSVVATFFAVALALVAGLDFDDRGPSSQDILAERSLYAVAAVLLLSLLGTSVMHRAGAEKLRRTALRVSGIRLAVTVAVCVGLEVWAWTG
jgi:hypothetical protein